MTPQSPESQQSAGPTRLRCPSPCWAHCVLLLTPHPSQPTGRRNHLQDQYRARSVSITSSHQFLGCPRVLWPREEMPGEDSAFLMVYFQLEHIDRKVWEEKFLPSAVQTARFRSWSLISGTLRVWKKMILYPKLFFVCTECSYTFCWLLP